MIALQCADGRIEVIRPGAEAVLGRAPDCAVRLDDPLVSARHGSVRIEGDAVTFMDLGSRNGSAVIPSGHKKARALEAHTPWILSAGDVLLLGGGPSPVRLEVTVAPDTAPEAPPAAVAPTIVARLGLVDPSRPTPPSEASRETLLALATLAASALACPEGEAGIDALAGAACRCLLQLLPGADGVTVELIAGGRAARLEATRLAPEPHASDRGVSRTLIDDALAGREAVLFVGGDARPLPTSRSVAMLEARAIVAAPLRVADAWFGGLEAWSARGPQSLPAASLEPVALVATLVALAAASLTSRERLAQENRLLRANVPEVAPGVVGTDPALRRALDLAQGVARAPLPVLVTGETGTGKELVAHAVHRFSDRAAGPFVACNCSAFPETLLESELFGHVRGAFTGAASDQPGLFVQADRGTLFLDEVGEMSPSMQARLLRVLEDGEVRPVGGRTPRRVDVRIVSATNRDLTTATDFRRDLLFRLNGVTVWLPPLRERRGDLPVLAAWFLEKEAARVGKRLPGFTREALALLEAHTFPGNIRELRNEIARAAALTPDGQAVRPDVLSEAVRSPTPALVGAGSLEEAVSRAERAALLSALDRSGGNVSAAAERLGLSRAGMYKAMHRLGIGPSS